MTVFKPAACTLDCWGSKFQDGEKECMQCRFKDSCREAMLARVVTPPPMMRPSLPVLSRTPYPPPPPPPQQTRNTIVPLPAKPFYAPPVNQLPVPAKPTLPPPTTTTQTIQQANHYYQQSTGYSLPNPDNPNPLSPMHRPGAPSPAYYFTQYPGESVGSRIIKNTILRALEAIMFELMQFFRHWTWPPARR